MSFSKWMTSLFKVTSISVTSIFVGVTSGCASWAAFLGGSEDVGAGVAAGVSQIPAVIVEGVSALESGGWTAAVVVTALGLIKAGVTGWGVANRAGKRRRLGEIAEGVKKANGGVK